MFSLLKVTFLVIFLSVSMVASEESVTIIPEEFISSTIYVEDGSKIRISCSHEKVAEVNNYTWLTPLRSFGETKQAKDVDGMSIMLKEKKNTFEYILEIESFSEDYVGEYGCWPMPRYESFMMSKLTLKRMIPENITAFPNETIWLECSDSYRGIQRIHSDWYRNGVVVSRRKKPKRIINLNYGSLILDNPEVGDSGLYECKALTPHGYLTKSIYQLNVVRYEDPSGMKAEPKIPPYTNVQSSRIYEGLEVKLRCLCDSCWPLTSFMWITPFGNFSASGDKQLPRDFSISKWNYARNFALNLTIQAARESHEGNYTCLLENTLGTYNDSVSFKILPDRVDIGKAVAFEGYRVKLRCNSDNVDRDPLWDRSSKFVKTHNISAYGVYSIFPVTSNDSGQYLCEYREYPYAKPLYSYGPRKFTARHSASYNLRVLSPNEELPMIVNRMNEGGKIKLNCGTEENANRIWTHNSHLIQSVVTCPMTKALVLVPVNNKTLTVEGRFSKNGVYRCKYVDSSNVVQKKKFLVLVEPLNLPKLQPGVPTHNLNNVTSEKSEVTVKRDFFLCEDFVTLGCKCVKNCQPLLSYNWTVPDSCPAAEISENLTNDPDIDDGFIYSLKVPTNCNGAFSCHLGNSKGTATHNFRITTIYGNSFGKENMCCPSKSRRKISYPNGDEDCWDP